MPTVGLDRLNRLFGCVGGAGDRANRFAHLLEQQWKVPLLPGGHAKQRSAGETASGSPCDYRYSWGYDYRGIWVDRGCRAQFEYGRRGNSGGGTGAAVAAGILGALVVGSAIASSKSGDDAAADRRDYYLDGYRHGQRDWDDDRRPDSQRYLDRFPKEYENDFSTGYTDGYNNRPSKYR